MQKEEPVFSKIKKNKKSRNDDPYLIPFFLLPHSLLQLRIFKKNLLKYALCYGFVCWDRNAPDEHRLMYLVN